MRNELKESYMVYIFLVIYLIINLIFLTRFPFVHSDESWLSGLSRSIGFNNDFSMTEPFFDIKDRYPHAIKIIFHGIQILFMKLLGYNIFSMRLISLIFGVFTLYFIYKLALFLGNKEKLALGALGLTALDIQYIYASHFARQEIILVFVLMLSIYIFFKHLPMHSTKTAILLGSLIGLSIGIHPNSFIISLPLLILYIYHIFFTKHLTIRHLVYYLLTLSVFALIFVGLSLYFDPRFFAHYTSQGQEFEVFNPLASKITEYKLFYLKLFHQLSGTYYIPNIKFQFFLFPVVLIISLILAYITKQKKYTTTTSTPRYDSSETIISLSLAIIALNIGIILLGRYNQTSVIFQFPIFYLLASYCIYSFPAIKNQVKNLFISVLMLTLGIISFLNISPTLDSSYEDYLAQISKSVPSDAVVLANLNTEYYFSLGNLHDYRNLSYLKDKDLSFSEYIHMNNIEYIIYPEEIEVIHAERPRWNGMYGPTTYYEEMKEYLENNCRLIDQFSAPVYGMRIVSYMNVKDWKVGIYQVNTKQ